MLTRLTLRQMRNALKSGEVTAGELIEAHLSQIERENPRINAFIEVYEEESRARVQRPLCGLLAGIPVTVKDSFDIAGKVTWCGSVLRRNERAVRDSTVVERLRGAGAVILGKTSTPEFLYYYETDNRIVGRTNHPWDVSRTPGGSSGGEAAAIASFMSAGGVGSDGGGSIREPAHFCGICGLKPTPGRVPAGGHWPEIAHPTGFMGVAGPMARTVEDVRILFEVLAGYDARDPFSAPVPFREWPSEGVRVAVMDQLPVQAGCAEALGEAVRLLGSMRHECAQFPFELIDGAHDLWRVLFVDYITQMLHEMIGDRQDDCAWTGVELMKYTREKVDVNRLGEVLARRDRMRARLLQWMGSVTVIVAPAFGTTAFPHRRPGMELMDAIMPVSPWNLLGMPSLVVPVCVGDDGMPAGVQLIGAPYTEELLLDLGVRLERARGAQWQTRRSSHMNTTSTTSTMA